MVDNVSRRLQILLLVFAQQNILVLNVRLYWVKSLFFYNAKQFKSSVLSLATHPCVTSPTTCQNGGTCSINGPDFLCHCPTGWTGTNCQTQESMLLFVQRKTKKIILFFKATPTTCDPNPCGAYGTCEQIVLPAPTGLTIFCRCQADWTGKFCDVSLSGTTATMTTATMTTATMTTATTTSGQSKINLCSYIHVKVYFLIVSSGCASNPCLNGGQCFNTGNTFICLCRQQFSGPTCAVQSVVTTPFPTTPSSKYIFHIIMKIILY